MSWNKILDQLEAGTIRAADRDGDTWIANVKVKEAILDAFKAGKNVSYGGIYEGFVDKDNLPPRIMHPDEGVRLVPGGSSIRRGAYVAEGVILMPPAYVNIGAYIDEGSMVDSHALVGSCAQIGRNVHLSAGVQIGGVLEPVGLSPVVVEDDCFVGAGSVIVEGILVKRGAVIAPGVTLSKSVPVYDCVHEKLLGKGAPIPERAVVVPGSRPVSNEWGKSQGLSISCPIIIKYRDEGSNASLELEEALR
ncbi:2,3,4,5-tetrahydropyridine-2,6-dicarboxylate N-succinyltransferase [Rhodohalobacter sp. SW132]|uniref:2,3,4,5-tetrahydropyridine-2,6-dicarboxylate N-succinyltransferase n=1 Tax=Rhodohalobacter sp. SW132 TaxID=2293433 RepID=UPI000E21EBE9|nr:2,3,4,5-tetrahydropyridine-2,6-dicarboxylate N-succinyltransferase [Rhodohalobacter sp. SW132]REL33327.1 2,3,4,5-tetrahydropyridine-2,6-dicarboxylate N-succinyltransferase [Rhodohalobacter sp. SW132]